MGDPLELSNEIVRSYNMKDFTKLKDLFHPALDFCHVNRGFAFTKREDLLGVLELFANRLMPDRRMQDPERVLVQGDIIVRIADWGGTAKADIPGFAQAGEKVLITICTLMRFDAERLLVEWKDYG